MTQNGIIMQANGGRVDSAIMRAIKGRHYYAGVQGEGCEQRDPLRQQPRGTPTRTPEKYPGNHRL
jgi:hypothetical protein